MDLGGGFAVVALAFADYAGGMPFSSFITSCVRILCKAHASIGYKCGLVIR